MDSNLISFVTSKLNCNEDEAFNFVLDFFDSYYYDLGNEAVINYREFFPNDFKPEAEELIKLGKQINIGHPTNQEIKKLLKAQFKEFNCGDIMYNVFENKVIIPHIKDNAEPYSKRCNAVACDVITYNADLVYLRNQADDKIYIIKTEDFE